LLPRVHIQFSDKEFQKLSRYNGKIKVTTRKTVKLFGERSGVSLFISKVVNGRKWKSSTLLLEPEYHSIFVESIGKPVKESNEVPSEEEFWIRNDSYFLKKEDEEILNSEIAWLNDRITGAAQKLICKTLGEEGNYQSVLNIQKSTGIPFNLVYHDHVQLLPMATRTGYLVFVPVAEFKYVTTLNRSSLKSRCTHYTSISWDSLKRLHQPFY